MKVIKRIFSRKPKQQKTVEVILTVEIWDIVAINQPTRIEGIRNLAAAVANQMNAAHNDIKVVYDNSRSNYQCHVYGKKHKERKDMDNTVLVDVKIQIDSDPNKNGYEKSFKELFEALYATSPTFGGTKLRIKTTP